MADKLRVDIPGLSRASTDVGDQAGIVSASHRQSVSSLSDAESGWVGSSAQALADMAGKWEKTTAKHQTAINNQAVHMDTAAKIFSYMEERNAAELKAVGDQADL